MLRLFSVNDVHVPRALSYQLTKQTRDPIVARIEWSIVLPRHFVYSDLSEACLLLSIYTTFISHRCQSSVLTCLADTMGVFCLSPTCKAAQINPSREEFWPLPPPSSQRSLWGALVDGRQRPATRVIPGSLPSFTKTMISLPRTRNPLIVWNTFHYARLSTTSFSHRPEVGENKTTLAGNVQPSSKMGTSCIQPPHN